MPTPRKTPRKRIVLDRVDAEAVREMLQGRGWRLFSLRLQKMLEQKRVELEQDQGEVNTAHCRGHLEALRAVASIPDILIREGMKAPAGDRDDG